MQNIATYVEIVKRRNIYVYTIHTTIYKNELNSEIHFRRTRSFLFKI